MATNAEEDDTFADFQGDSTQPTEEILSELSKLTSIKDEAALEPRMPPPSEYDSLTAELAERPHNPDGWRRLVQLAEDSRDIEKISAAYEALLKQYPNNATAQIQYISHFVGDQSSEKAEDLFKKYLMKSPWVELWNFYLTYIRRLNTAPSQREVIKMSYEFALNHVGQDKDSGQIWSDYIQFLQAGEAATTWDQQQKMDSLRKVYHRAVQIPLDNVERLWQELETFETGLNKITAKKFMADLSPAHMQARTVLRQLVNHVGPLYPATNEDMYLPPLPTFDASERALVGKWKAYLKWEESNPLELEEKDKATLITRIQCVYRKAVIRMRYYTEIWFMAYTWTNSVGKHDEAISILKAGLEANPASYLLTFTYAEALEIKKEYAEVHTLYEKFLGVLRERLERLDKYTKATINGNTSQSSNDSDKIQNGSNNNDAQGASFNGTQPEEDQVRLAELQKHRTEYGLAWIMYMRFAWRAEGVKVARSVFSKARKDTWSPWEVYEAAALNEYHCSNDKGVASRIFEKGLELFGEEIEFVLRYLGFLISINDKNNARALFERVIPKFPAERARPLWERWARYEYQYGDLEAALKLEKRMAEVYVSDPPIKRLAQRHIYLGTDAIAERDLGFAIARRGNVAATSASFDRLNASQGSLANLQNSSSSMSQPSHSNNKRAASPEHRVKREEGRGDYAAGHKRPRPASPARPSERDRDGRWEGPSQRRRFSPPPPPSWERDDRGPNAGRGGRDNAPPGRAQERDDDKRPGQAALPPVISWFIGELPAPSSFDGPVFRTDDLMNLFRNAVIPSTTSRMKSPPPPPRTAGAGRPPPDYGPYQGPNSSGRGRRY
ncbi:Suf-domain-containing protein [Agrocybe pediades]|nr:Suf-domain-containing protein [Agrocybe pediades]